MEGFGARHLIDTPMMKYEYRSERFWYNLAKRIGDILLSLIALIILSPLLLLTALLIKIEDRGPVFFRQKRCTKNGKVFEILKFRSMIVDAEKGGETIPCRTGDPRITHVGRVIRKLRIDEFPQIINVLKGDMSIVGPRPERVEHVAVSYTHLARPARRARHSRRRLFHIFGHIQNGTRLYHYRHDAVYRAERPANRYSGAFREICRRPQR